MKALPASLTASQDEKKAAHHQGDIIA